MMILAFLLSRLLSRSSSAITCPNLIAHLITLVCFPPPPPPFCTITERFLKKPNTQTPKPLKLLTCSHHIRSTLCCELKMEHSLLPASAIMLPTNPGSHHCLQLINKWATFLMIAHNNLPFPPPPPFWTKTEILAETQHPKPHNLLGTCPITSLSLSPLPPLLWAQNGIVLSLKLTYSSCHSQHKLRQHASQPWQHDPLESDQQQHQSHIRHPCVQLAHCWCATWFDMICWWDEHGHVSM